MLCAGRGQRAPDLALSAAPHARAHGGGAGGNNRGAALAGGKVFMDTDNAHLIALNRAGRDAAVGYRDRRFEAELQREFGAARWSAIW